MTNGRLMVGTESTFNTPVTPTRGFEYNPPLAPIKPTPGRTTGNPIRPGSRARRKDRMTPWFHHGEGTIPMDVMDKGFGFWLAQMLGSVSTTGPVSTYYTHTGADTGPATLMGDSFTAQFDYPFMPGQPTDQPITWAGGKVTEWTLSNSVEEDLVCELSTWFASVATATALATPSYPSSMTNLTWVGGVITVGGSAVPVTDVSITGNNNMNVDRRYIRGDASAKEPTPGELEVEVTFTCDWDSLTHWNRVMSATQAGTNAAFTAAWTAGSASLTVTIPALEMNGIDLDGDIDLSQALTGNGVYDGTNSVVSIAYVTTDTTP